MKKKRSFKKILAAVLALALIVGIIPLTIRAVKETEEPLGEEIYSAGMISAEIVELRDECVKHFLLDNGAHIAVSYANPVHYEENGQWKDVDNRLMLSNSVKSVSGEATYVPRAGTMPASIPQDLANGQMLTMGYAGYTIGIGVSANNPAVYLESAAQVMAVEALTSTILQKEAARERESTSNNAEKSQEELIEEHNKEFTTLKNLSSAVTYENVFPDTDIEYILSVNCVKENLIVKTTQGSYIYRFDLELDGLIPVPQEDGSIWLTEQNDPDNAIFILPAAFMYDANGEYSDAVTMTLEDGILTLEADAAWINDPQRTLPVVIDPTITSITDPSATIQDAYVKSFPIVNGNNYSTGTRLYAGRSLAGEIHRTYIKLGFPALPSGGVVTKATLDYRKDMFNVADNTLNIYDCNDIGTWEISQITWNNQSISKTANGHNNNPNLPLLDFDSGVTWGSTTYSFKITTAAERWYENGDNNGLLITSEDETATGNVYLISIGAILPSNRPLLSIQYKVVGTITVNYDDSERTSGDVPASQTFSTPTLPAGVELSGPGTMEKTDYVLSYWLRQDGAKFAPGETVHVGTATNDTWTLAAVWAQPTGTVDISYDVDGGKAPGGGAGYVAPQAAGTPGSIALRPIGDITKPGGYPGGEPFNYTFAGWLCPDGVIRLGGSFMYWDTVTDDQITLEAIWWDPIDGLFNRVGPDGLIESLPSDEYSHRLALNVSDATGPNRYGLNYGFENYGPFLNADPNPGEAAYRIMHKNNIVGPAGDRSLIVVSIRGTDTNTGDLWTDLASELECTYQPYGFLGARDFMYAKFQQYIDDHQNELVNPIVLVTGHSLGGAVSNLLAEHLNNHEFGCEDGNCPGCVDNQEIIYSYTFAAPNAVQNFSESDSNGNIFNILNRNDWIPLVPLTFKPLNNNPFGRYGIDIPITMPTAPDNTPHDMPTYRNWMGDQDADLSFAEITSISKGDITRNLLPRLLDFKCPVGIAVCNDEDEVLAYESQGGSRGGGQGSSSWGSNVVDSDVISWITEEGEKLFFVPNGSDASYASVIANDVGTMTFSIAAIDASADDPFEDNKIIDPVELYTDKEFLINLAEDSWDILIQDIQLLLIENGIPIGKVNEDGREIFFPICSQCGEYDCDCFAELEKLETLLLYYALVTAGVPGSDIRPLVETFLDTAILRWGQRLVGGNSADDLITALLDILNETDEFETLFPSGSSLRPWATFASGMINDLRTNDIYAFDDAAIELILTFYAYLIYGGENDIDALLSLVAEERAYEILWLYPMLAALLSGEAFEDLILEEIEPLEFSNDFAELFDELLPEILELEIPDIDNLWALYDGWDIWGYSQEQAKEEIPIIVALANTAPYVVAALIASEDGRSYAELYQLGPQPPISNGCYSIDVTPFIMMAAHFVPIADAIRTLAADTFDLDIGDENDAMLCDQLAIAFLTCYFSNYWAQVDLWLEGQGKPPLELPNTVMNQLLNQAELLNNYLGQQIGLKSGDLTTQLESFFAEINPQTEEEPGFFARLYTSIVNFFTKSSGEPEFVQQSGGSPQNGELALPEEKQLGFFARIAKFFSGLFG